MLWSYTQTQYQNDEYLPFKGITRPLIPLLVRLSTNNTREICDLTKNSHLVAKKLQKTFRVQPSFAYPASRGPSIFLDKSGRGRDLCQPPRLSLIFRSSTETDKSVRFETSFSRFCSVRMCFVRNCWLNTRPRYVRYARQVHNSIRFSFEGCLW